MARTSGTKNITKNGDQTYQASGGINIVSDNSNIILKANPSTGKVIIEQGDVAQAFLSEGTKNVGTIYNPTGNDPINIDQTMYSTTATRKLASAYFAGGVGIEKDLAVGGFIFGRIAEASTATTSSNVVITTTNAKTPYYLLFAEKSTTTLAGYTLFEDVESPFAGSFINGEYDNTEKGLVYFPNTDEGRGGVLNVDNVAIVSTASSATIWKNALYVEGGIGVNKDIVVGGAVYPAYNFADSYLNDVYEKYLNMPATTGTLVLGAGITDIFGDLRVRGKIYGTAPTITNTLYVTVDGDDTNDGRGQDSSRACRTIGGALNSPYYQPGTQILVSAGRYLEDNPLRLKPYTSIRGSDIRTTFIEPINKTQDLFHMDSGCYLNYMTFLNGRSGLLEGQYAPGFNRGAYATAFPPLTGSDKINLFQSPYIQNCTNQSGPWLKDGTMFVPNQTIQVPAAVGTGTWAANTTTIVVTVSTGTIEQGMKVNSGCQNPGFYSARTLLLANKQFLQEQVVEYVNDTFPSFIYSQEYCYRDVGILVENVIYDATFGGNEKTVESGLAYYDGVVSRIAGQETQTVAAINTLSFWSQQIVQNFTCTNTSTLLTPQTINTAMVGGSIATASIATLFDTIADIITNGPDAAPDVYKAPGPDSAFVSAEILIQANRTFIQENTLNYINNYLAIPEKNLKFNKIKCKRDVGLIVDSIALDMLYPTDNHSQSTFAGLQYFTQSDYTGDIPNEITTTTSAIQYLKDLVIKVIQNVTPADDLVQRYSASVQDTSLEAAGTDEVYDVSKKFDVILKILRGDNKGWTDRIISNGKPKDLPGVRNAVAILKANKENDYFADEIIAYVNTEFSSFTPYYTEATCRRDVGYIIDSVMFDLLHGGNRQSVQAGLSYYGFDATRSIRDSEKAATTSSFYYISSLTNDIILGVSAPTYQNRIKQIFSTTVATPTEAASIAIAVNTVTNIIWNGTDTVTWGLTPISTGTSISANGEAAFDLLMANKDFIKAEVINMLDRVYNQGSFNYDEELCYRDTGLIVDAVSQDILLGGNQKSIEAGLSYWNQGYNYVAKQVTTTTLAIEYARDLCLSIAANQAVVPQTGTVSTQIINSFFQYGNEYGPQEAIARNFGIITNIIENGPSSAPPVYAGGGLFSLTGLNGSSVKLSPTITSVSNVGDVYTLGLSTSTIGFGTNATLYFGDTTVIPYQNETVEELSLEFTGSTSTWSLRKVDPIGSMGGSLVDGAVISDISPIQSFVYDAFTQVNQGGRGIRVTNNGYAQLVSVFTIFCSVGVQVDNGGIASITNSNCNFGDLSLVAKGYGEREFSGTVVNPEFRAYPFSPSGQPGSDELDQYFPNGYWPQAGKIGIFVPDKADRPHIALVMEVEPPEFHINEQGFPGFLNAQPSTSTLTTGSIALVDIDMTDVAIGNYVFIRDQYGRQWNDDGAWYAATGTVVTDMNYNSIVLNQALQSGGGEADNPNYFTLYFCGNSYYTVLSSSVANNPYAPDTNLLWANSDPWYQGPSTDQTSTHIAALLYLNGLVNDVVDNVSIVSTLTQVTLPSVTGGAQAIDFIDQRFTIMTDIIGAPSRIAAEAVVPPRAITKTGTVVPGAGSAVTLIRENLDFLSGMIRAWVESNFPSWGAVDPDQKDYILAKCNRDVKLILRRLCWDLESGGTYNSVFSGLSYWSREGTYHVVELAEAVTRTDLFPDGCNVNFYQRSYISASGYLFEYVGAGTNYGALPQVGRADPVQSKEVVQLDAGKVFYTSTDQNGDFRIGPGLTISQATGVLSGRTFVQSLYGNLTPFILAIEGGG